MGPTLKTALLLAICGTSVTCKGQESVAAEGCKRLQNLSSALVIQPRIPSVDDFVASATCKAKAGQLIEKWKADDIANYAPLSNRVCAAMDGWVERVPGTCQAGGPPPICKADHWYKDPLLSVQRLRQDQETVRSQRQKELQGAACDCYASEIQNSTSSAVFNKPAWNPYSARPSPAPYSDPNVMTCSTTCPIDGYKCVSGICQAPTFVQTLGKEAAEKLGDKADDLAIDLVEDAAKDDLFGLLGQRVTALFESAGMKTIGMGVGILLTPTSTGAWSSVYQDSLRQVENDRRSLGSDYSNLISILRGRNPWAPGAKFSPQESLRISQALSEIRASKDLLRQHLDSLNTAHNGLQMDQDLGSKVCYKAVAAANANINASAAIVLALPDSEVHLGAP